MSFDLWGMTVSHNINQREGVDRRRFLKGAATIAWAAPVIATLSTSPAYANGEGCGKVDELGNCPEGNCGTGLNCRRAGQSNNCTCK